MAVVLLPAILAAEAGGQKRFEVDARTVGEALGQLPVRNLVLDEAGELRRLVNVYVDGVDVRGRGLLEEELRADSEVRIIGAIAGG
jgi:molybdopterin converting factor small subunit